MENINKSLEKFLEEKNWQNKIDDELQSSIDHPVFKQWWQAHPEWSREELGRFMIKINQYTTEQEHCTICSGLDACQNVMKGHAPELFDYGQVIDLSYSPCKYQREADQQNKRRELIKSQYIPNEIMKATFREFDDTDESRIEACTGVLNFCKDAVPGQNGIGLYLYGPLGVGKSFLLGAACNKLAERGISTLMIYTPDFFREIKGAIADQKVEEKLQALKEVSVLILDDIGAESISAWARDEVLGALLQYRVTHKLPTLYTSNYDYDQLEEHLAYSQKGGIEQLKAKRIMERIRHYTENYFVEGRNRRVR